MNIKLIITKGKGKDMRFEKINGVIHVYADGEQSNEGIFYEGCDVWIHDRIHLDDIFENGMSFNTIRFDRCPWFVSSYEQYYAKKLITRPNYCFPSWFVDFDSRDMIYHYRSVTSKSLADIEVLLIDHNGNVFDNFVIKKGTSKNFFYYLEHYYGYRYYEWDYSHTREFITKENFPKLKTHALDFYLTYNEMFDCETVVKYLRRVTGRFLNECFEKCPDDLAIKAIESGFISKAMLKKLLDKANDTGRVNLAAIILDITGEDNKNLSRFAI